MDRKKIRAAIHGFIVPFLLLSGGALLSAACTKHTAGNYLPVPANPDTMLNNSTKKYLALGDSYTIGTSVNETDRYPVQTLQLLRAQGYSIADAEIIATNGWTTGDLLNAVKEKPALHDYSLVSLLIGVNNQYQGRTLDEYRQQFTLLLQRAIQLADGKPAHVFVLSIPDYSVTPFANGQDKQKIAAEIDAFNDANKSITERYKVNYLYITDESRRAAGDLSLVAADGLHFSGKEYTVWSQKLALQMKVALQ